MKDSSDFDRACASGGVQARESMDGKTPGRKWKLPLFASRFQSSVFGLLIVFFCGLGSCAAQEDPGWKIFHEGMSPLNWGTGCLGPLWDWGMVRVFKRQCELAYEIGAVLRLNGKGGDEGMFGVEVKWPYRLPVGYSYQFRAYVQPPPDFITVNSRKAWQISDGYYDKGFVHFVHTPEADGDVVVTFVRKMKDGTGTMVFGPRPDGGAGSQSKPSFFCLRKEGGVKGGDAGIFQWPEKMEWMEIDPHLKRSLCFDASQRPVEYDKPPLRKPSYPTEELAFCNCQALIKGHVERDGVNAFQLEPASLDKPWETMEGLCRNEKIKCLFVNASLFGGNLMKIVLDGQLERNVEKLRNYLAGFLDAFPDLRVYLWVYEADGQNFGKWEKSFPHSVRNSWFFNLPGRQGLNQGALAEVYQACCAAQKPVYEKIKKLIGHPDRVKILFMACDSMFELDAFCKAGADLLVNKHIERQNQNLVVANVRGVARACGKEYGFDHDCYRERDVQGYTPREYEEGLRVYYYGGGKLFWDEVLAGTGTGLVRPHPTAMGVAWLDFVRWASVHPVRGESMARIAFMRSYGKKGKEFPEHYAVNPDFFVMETVFPEFYHSATSRLSTGTPYGPADILPPDAGLEILKRYGLIVYLGSEGCCMDEEKFRNLAAYVREGGTLVMPMGQLRQAKGELIARDLSGWAGVKAGEDRMVNGKRIVALETSTASVVKRLEDGTPLVVKNEAGKGKVFLYASENLTDFEQSLPVKRWNDEVKTQRYARLAPSFYGELLKPLLTREAWLRLAPRSDWLEYQVSRKGESWVFAFMNHGRAGYPGGNGVDQGVWRGKVAFDLKKLALAHAESLEVFEALYRENAATPFGLEPRRGKRIGGEWVVQMTVDRWTEMVIGPAQKAKNDYFGKK
ncbi:MAG: hypothetical protein PHV34_09245 [Verrucomicrobiae bacterium]|nr:hypothetical protein [Verrucomicrobiae bacterium]